MSEEANGSPSPGREEPARSPAGDERQASEGRDSPKRDVIAKDRSRSRSRGRSETPPRRRRSRTPPPKRRSPSPDRRRRRSPSPSERRRRSRSRSRDRRRSRSRSRDRYRDRRDDRRRSPPRRGGRSPSPPRIRGDVPKHLTMFVAGMTFICDEKDLRHKFSKYGNVLEARVVRDNYSGSSRGFGFVSMSTDAEVDDAIAGLNGREWDGRRILVERAKRT